MLDTKHNAVRTSNQLESKSLVRDHQQNNAVQKPPKCIFARVRRKYVWLKTKDIIQICTHYIKQAIPSYIFIIVIIYTPPTIPT
jgi:hypothetical protein